MLYKLNQDGSSTTFVRLTPTTLQTLGRREKDMERWLTENPHAVLPESERALVFSDEESFENLADILAVDPQGNVLIVEIKRGRTPRDVVAQALEYAADVATWDYAKLNSRAAAYFAKRGLAYESLLGAFQAVFDLPPGEFDESKFNAKQRLFIVAETIDEKVERTARWLLRRGVEIACIRYECFTTGEDQLFIDFEEVVRREEASTPDAGGAPRSRSAAPSEEEVVGRLSGIAQSLYQDLKERVLRFGDDVSTGATSGYLKFLARRNFAELHPQRERIKVYVRPEGFGLAQDESADINGIRVHRISDKFLWTLNHEFLVDPSTNLDAVEALLRRSYQSAR